ncbi:MAG: hypothetical protein U0Q11_04265 [Vicinamibacterales bacterium]
MLAATQRKRPFRRAVLDGEDALHGDRGNGSAAKPHRVSAGNSGNAAAVQPVGHALDSLRHRGHAADTVIRRGRCVKSDLDVLLARDVDAVHETDVVRIVLHDELVRMPSPKKRTPFINAPSVTPVAAKMTREPGARSFDL